MELERGATVRRRNPRGSGHALRTELIGAAARLLATMERPETLTLRQVAREVSVAPASIYGHFPDLGALIQHVLHLRYEELAALMDASAEGADSPIAELVERSAAYVRWGVAHAGEYRTLFGGGMPDDLGPLGAHGAGEDLLGSVVEAFARLRAHDAPTPEDWRRGLLLWTGLHGLVALYNGHGSLDWPPLDELIAEVVSVHTGQPLATIADGLEAIGPPGSINTGCA